MSVLSKSFRWLFVHIIAARFTAPLEITGHISSRRLFFTVRGQQAQLQIPLLSHNGIGTLSLAFYSDFQWII